MPSDYRDHLNSREKCMAFHDGNNLIKNMNFFHDSNVFRTLYLSDRPCREHMNASESLCAGEEWKFGV